jgi:anaerobic C4-dicarboxylate transporter
MKAKIGVAILVLSVGLLTAMPRAQTDIDNMLVRLAGIAAAAAALISGIGLAWLGHRWET